MHLSVITFIDGHNVWDSISWVQNNACGPACAIQGENSLDAHVEGWHIEGLKQDLVKQRNKHSITICLWLPKENSKTSLFWQLQAFWKPFPRYSYATTWMVWPGLFATCDGGLKPCRHDHLLMCNQGSMISLQLKTKYMTRRILVPHCIL